MQFPIIHINKRAASEKEKKVLANFTSLRLSDISKLKKANSDAEKIPHQFIGLKGKSSSAYRHEFAQSIEKSDSDQFRQLADSYSSDTIKQKMHNWYIEQDKALNKEQTWKQFLKACQDPNQKAMILYLKGKWAGNAVFSYYTSEALMELATNYIPLFEEYLALLMVELSTYKNKLSEKPKKEIQSYINTLRWKIRDEKINLAQAMVSRLKVASETGDIKYDDITVNLASGLKKANVLKETYALPRHCRRNLDDKTLDYFQRFILKNGTLPQKNALEQLIWNQSDHHYIVSKLKDVFLVLPQNLKDSVRNKGFIQWLFNIADQKEQFFKARFPLITQFRFHPKPKEHFKSLIEFHDNSGWQELCDLSHQASKEYEFSLNIKPLSFVDKLFSKDKLAFAKSWQVYLREQQKGIVDAMLDYAKTITEQLKTRLKFGLDLDALCSKQFKSDITNFNDELLSAIKLAGLDNACPDYQNFLLYFERINNLPQELAEAKRKKLEEEKAKINTIEDFIEWSGIQDNEIKFDILNPFQPVTDKEIVDELQMILQRLTPKSGPLDYKNKAFKEEVSHLESYLNAYELSHSHLFSARPELTAQLNQLFISFLNALVNCVDEEDEENQNLIKNLALFESLLMRVAPTFTREMLEELIDVRTNLNWFAFQTKCYALLVCLEENKEQEDIYLKKLEEKLSNNLPRALANNETNRCGLQSARQASFFHSKKTDLEPIDQPFRSYEPDELVLK